MVRLVRAGNSCQIWEALDDNEKKRVALKVLQKEFVRDRVEINYLKHEHAIGKDLKHPQVIEIYDFRQDLDIPFLVLEYFRGKNIKQLMRLEPELLQANMTSTIDQCAEGLHYLHKQGWVHRDVKPDNFLLDEEGTVKLIDFALARKPVSGFSKLFGGRAPIQGTRSYMAPEQIRGKAVDPRSDVYSLGCMVFELLAKKLPFTAANENELLNKHLRAPIPQILTFNTDVTQEMNDLIVSTMAKDVENRPRHMLKFLQDFRRIRVFRSKKV